MLRHMKLETELCCVVCIHICMCIRCIHVRELYCQCSPSLQDAAPTGFCRATPRLKAWHNNAGRGCCTSVIERPHLCQKNKVCSACSMHCMQHHTHSLSLSFSASMAAWVHAHAQLPCQAQLYIHTKLCTTLSASTPQALSVAMQLIFSLCFRNHWQGNGKVARIFGSYGHVTTAFWSKCKSITDVRNCLQLFP